MMYNLKEYMDIEKYNDYIIAFEGDRDIVSNYPDKNITQFFYIKAKEDAKIYFILLVEKIQNHN